MRRGMAWGTAAVPVVWWGLGCGVVRFPEPAPQSAVDVSAIPLARAAQRTPVEELRPGVTLQEVRLGGPPHQPGAAGVLWVYRPVGDHEPGSLPAVVIAPAGSDGLTGMHLALGDRAEHLPYVEAGYVVVAYSVDGVDEVEGPRRFAAAKGGLVNTMNALSFIEEEVPEVNREQVFAVGHSSAADVAMLAASHFDLAGAVAFNSAGQGCWFQPEGLLNLLRVAQPGFVQSCQETRASNHVGHLRSPLLLFGAADDEVVPLGDIEELHQRLVEAGATVELQRGQGGHYASMRDHGIPKALEWMQTIRSGG